MPVLMPDPIVVPPTPIADLSGAQLMFNGLTLDASEDAGPLTFSRISGWEDLPDAQAGGGQRPNSHGVFPGPVRAGGRTVIVGGACVTPGQRDAQLAELQRAMAFTATGYGLSDLTITLAGRTLTAQAQAVRFSPDVAEDWAAGVFGWVAQWFCSDPLRYGTQVSLSTGLPQLVGGLEYDLYTDGAGTDVGYLDYGPAGTSGKLTLSNTGTAEARPSFVITGTLPDGFELAETYTGRRLRYEGPIAASPGDPVYLDAATGRVRLGSADRRGLLTRAEWWGVPPRGVREVLFSSLGSYSADAQLTATFRPAFW